MALEGETHSKGMCPLLFCKCPVASAAVCVCVLSPEGLKLSLSCCIPSWHSGCSENLLSSWFYCVYFKYYQIISYRCLLSGLESAWKELNQNWCATGYGPQRAIIHIDMFICQICLFPIVSNKLSIFECDFGKLIYSRIFRDGFVETHSDCLWFTVQNNIHKTHTQNKNNNNNTKFWLWGRNRRISTSAAARPWQPCGPPSWRGHCWLSPLAMSWPATCTKPNKEIKQCVSQKPH